MERRHHFLQSRADTCTTACVCGIDDEDFLVLDPYFPAEEQPFRLSQDRFVRCFAGYLVRVSMRG